MAKNQEGKCAIKRCRNDEEMQYTIDGQRLPLCDPCWKKYPKEKLREKLRKALEDVKREEEKEDEEELEGG